MGGKSLLCAGVFQGELERGCFDFRRTPLELPLLAPSDWGVQGVIDLLKGIDACASQERVQSYDRLVIDRHHSESWKKNRCQYYESLLVWGSFPLDIQRIIVTGHV